MEGSDDGQHAVLGLAFRVRLHQLCTSGDGGQRSTSGRHRYQFGSMEIRFFPEKAPKHVENFIKLARSGFYNGTIFHRVIPGFMIQGGDPNTKDKTKTAMYGIGGPGYTVKAEFNERSHKRGVVSMARSQDPNSAGSQFFIVVQDATFLDRKYTVFGEVVNGISVADKIVSQQRDGRDNPLERIEMTVRIVEPTK
jgi:peptidyl-prolyl cis-trans isomerase B (cyclophilin B)